MNKARKVAFGLAVGITVCTVVTLVQAKPNAASTKSEATTTQQEVPAHIKLDLLSRKAAKGDEAAMKDATDLIFTLSGVPPELAASVGITDRVVSSEKDFTASKHEATTEEAVVNAVNSLASFYKLPEYAKTDLEEVQLAHFHLTTVVPNLFAARGKSLRAGDDPNKMFHTQMSPLEATALSTLLVRQKLLNPAFQKTAVEKEMDREGKSYKPVDRSTEIIAAFQSGTSGKSASELLGSTNLLLDGLRMNASATQEAQ